MYRPCRSSSYMDGYHHYYDCYPQSNHLTSVRSLGRTFWSGEDTGPDLWFEGNDLWRAQPTRRPRCSCCLFLFYTRLPLIFISNLTALLLSLLLHLSLSLPALCCGRCPSRPRHFDPKPMFFFISTCPPGSLVFFKGNFNLNWKEKYKIARLGMSYVILPVL